MAYQDESYAAGYAELVGRVREAEAGISPGLEFAAAVARNLYKLMAYKDEYEVARLSLDPQLTANITAQFGEGARYRYRLHPPVLRALGMTSKISLGPWFRPGFRLLAAGRRLRGTPWDPFGRTQVRRTERALVERVPRGHRPVADRADHGQPCPGGRDRRAPGPGARV